MVLDSLRGLLGVLVLLIICYAVSEHRKRIDWKLVGTGLLLQFIFALLVLKVPMVKSMFEGIASIFVVFLDFTKEGSRFLFGKEMIDNIPTHGYIFAFQVLPTVLFFSAFTSLMYYLGILQKIVYGIAWVMNRSMRLSGAESLSTAGNIFLGQTESPLLIKPYLAKMTRSELLCVMVGGMATIAGGVLAAYVGFLGGTDPVQQQLYATHLLSASIMSAPAAIVATKMILPEVHPEHINHDIEVSKEKIGANMLEAIANGTSDGLKLAVNVGAMLIVFTALIYMVNYTLQHSLGNWFGLNEYVNTLTAGKYTSFSLQFILGSICAPLAWLLGVPSVDMMYAGQLLGEKTILNEFYAYATMGGLKINGLMSERGLIICTYALCGFSNFASIGIQIGGIGALAPNQKSTLAQLGIKALIGGSVACFLTAAIAGLVI
ncbi:MAG: Na+ dependent nucleoside transporter [Saprospiraceae bacterium]|uniref:Na+ dependent nucleoside transporter n=1 Tax=Candidatus Defluviibacterium haderslevense TaxID=2981993 RepID=A0A9D7SAT0_9BACT|nr:Na+ dependent nucleoside transporter [Candidatus Defluviibacterium haderslevense]MBL0235430.1 Na+ dependent nucleoside transporter [Candidatus Defluviibacterium haderslevense]